MHAGTRSDDTHEDRYSRFEAAYDELLHLPAHAQGAALAPLYEALFGPTIGRMSRAPTSALRQLSMAATVMGGVSGHPTYPDHHLRAFRTLEQRGVIETMDVNVLYRHLVSAREFVAARIVRAAPECIAPAPACDRTADAATSGHTTRLSRG